MNVNWSDIDSIDNTSDDEEIVLSYLSHIKKGKKGTNNNNDNLSHDLPQIVDESSKNRNNSPTTTAKPSLNDHQIKKLGPTNTDPSARSFNQNSNSSDARGNNNEAD